MATTSPDGACALRGLTQTPCARCWPVTDSWDQWTQLTHEVERLGDSPFEGQFVDRVLRHVPRLTPSEVSPQIKTEGASGRTYIVDFLLRTPSGERVIVEIDGTDKAPGERSVEQVQRRVEERRTDLQRRGWRMLNLSNNRVVTHSEECITEVDMLLQDTVHPTRVTGTATDPFQHAGALADQQPSSAEPTHQLQTRQQSSSGPSGRGWLLALGALIAAAGIGFFLLVPGDGSPGTEPTGPDCPASAPIKGNDAGDGEKIYHRPAWRYYEATWPEQCFSRPQEAEDAGYRPSEVQ